MWAGIKYALNSTLGNTNFKPLDQIIKDSLNLKEVEITANGEFYPESDSLGFKKITVNVEEEIYDGSVIVG